MSASATAPASRRGRIRRRVATLGLVGAVVALVVGTALPARAQQSGSSSGPGVELRLEAISPVTGPRTPLAYRLSVRNSGSTPLRDLRIQGGLGGPIGTRSELERLADDPEPRAPRSACRRTPNRCRAGCGSDRQGWSCRWCSG